MFWSRAKQILNFPDENASNITVAMYLILTMSLGYCATPNNAHFPLKLIDALATPLILMPIFRKMGGLDAW